jgi:hypothetical protein
VDALGCVLSKDCDDEPVDGKEGGIDGWKLDLDATTDSESITNVSSKGTSVFAGIASARDPVYIVSSPPL